LTYFFAIFLVGCRKICESAQVVSGHADSRVVSDEAAESDRSQKSLTALIIHSVKKV
jgi:predicted metal-dependent peptidase